MELLLSIYKNQFLIFLLVLTRVSGLVTVAPLWSSRAIPVRVRALLATGIAMIITPLWWHTPVEDPGNVVHLAVLLVSEFAIGASLGLAVLICFVGMELAGQLLGQMTGMRLANMASPEHNNTISVFSQFLRMLMLAVFVVAGGHEYLLHVFFRVFERMPPGQAHVSMPLVDALTKITSYSFVLGLQLAAPMIVAVLLSLLVMGLIGRTMPQFNVLAVGFGINSLVMVGALLLSLGVMVRVFQFHGFRAIDLIAPVLNTSSP
ncbi:MAG: flagellar biosynthetic protein FliR [Planctomycetota bacterium]